MPLCEQRTTIGAPRPDGRSSCGPGTTNVGAVKRLTALVLILMSLAVPVQAASFPAPVVVAQHAQDEPAVVVDNTVGLPTEPAWTFRFLVPTLMVLSLAMVVGLIVWYQRGFNGRYRVRQ